MLTRRRVDNRLRIRESYGSGDREGAIWPYNRTPPCKNQPLRYLFMARLFFERMYYTRLQALWYHLPYMLLQRLFIVYSRSLFDRP
jgi:hypothetical protein